MGPKVQVVDTSVLIAYMDARDPHHHAAHHVLASTPTADRIISTVTYADVLVGVFRREPSSERLERLMSEVSIVTFPVADAVAIQSALLRSKHRLDLPDALIIATAEVLKAGLLTADRSWLRITPRAELIRT